MKILATLALTLALGLQLLVGLIAFAPAPAYAEAAPPQIAAPAGIAVDVATGRIIYSKNMHRRVPMASTTKIITALTALAVPGTSLSENYTVVKADLVGEASIPLREGEVISFQDLLWGTLMNSGNDGAMAIARYAGSKLPGTGDPVTKFVAQMNTFAASIGMRNSHYANPHGLDQDGQYSSAFDLAISGWYLLKNPLLSRIVSTQAATVAGHPLSNLNTLLKRYNGANGIKPGQTDNAGLCLVASATRDNATVITVVVGEEAVGYKADPSLLLDYSFGQLKDPAFLQTIQQGASAVTSDDFIGRPNGDKLIVYNAPGDSGVINAQISTVGTTPGATVTPQDGANAASATDPNAKGGLNFFSILLILLILLGLVYVALRFTPLGGDKGRKFAYTLEDTAVKGLQGIRQLWQYLKPGSHEDEPVKNQSARPPKSNLSLNNAPDYRTRLPRETTPGKVFPPPVNNQSTQPGLRDEPGAQTFYRPTGAGSFDNMFDDEAAFEPGNLETNPARGPQPPRPLSGRAGADYPAKAPEASQPSNPSTLNQRTQPTVRPTSQPQTTRPNPLPGNYGAGSPGREVDKTPSYNAPGNPAPQGTTGNRPPESFTANRGAAANPPDSSENIMLHARQAIDYAYAGRIAASTEEFKRVIEQNPLFDFGTIDEFEQIPVLGYKALATAYRDTGKLKFAILLLDMAVENYPNELELRNMLRHLRREAGQ